MSRSAQAEAAESYSKVRMQTAPKRTAIYLLHEKCLHLLIQSKVYTEKRRYLLDRAQNILSKLQASLIGDDETTQALFFLYDYCYALLEHDEDAVIQDAISIVSPLRNTFFVLLKLP